MSKCPHCGVSAERSTDRDCALVMTDERCSFPRCHCPASPSSELPSPREVAERCAVIVDEMQIAWHDSNEEYSGHYMDAAQRIADVLRERAKHPFALNTAASHGGRTVTTSPSQEGPAGGHADAAVSHEQGNEYLAERVTEFVRSAINKCWLKSFGPAWGERQVDMYIAVREAIREALEPASAKLESKNG